MSTVQDILRALRLFYLSFLIMAIGLDCLAADAVHDRMQRRARIAFVLDSTRQGAAEAERVFREQLTKNGYIEGDNLELLERFTDGQQSHLPQIMRDVVETRVDVIVTNATPAAMAARTATKQIPVVVLGMADPVRAGLVESLSRPAGNLTGLSMGYDQAFVGKWLELLHEVVPRLKTVAVMSNPNNPMHRYQEEDVVIVAKKRNLSIRVVPVAGLNDLDLAFKKVRKNAQAAIIFGDAATLGDKRSVTSVAAAHRVPVMYGAGSFVEEGGLIAYSPDILEMARRTADLAAMILRGARAEELPVEQPPRFELAVNLSAAREIGITIPESVLVRADRVIR